MGLDADDNPFQAGTGHVPAVLAGRDDEIERLTLVLKRLGGARRAGGKLAKPPFPPVKIVGPRGVGKTALLNWAKGQAEGQGTRFVSCESLAQDQGQSSMRTLLENMAGRAKSMLGRIRSVNLGVVEKAGVGVEFRQIESIYAAVAAAAVKKGPLLLLLDEVQHYDLPLLKAVLQGSQKLIGEGYPLGLVLAGTPGLDSHLAKAESTFIVRSQNIYINTLSDAATRAALGAPFEDKGVAVTPAALKALGALADNYPFFIQLVGQEAWYEMVKTGRREIDARLVRRIEGKARHLHGGVRQDNRQRFPAAGAPGDEAAGPQRPQNGQARADERLGQSQPRHERQPGQGNLRQPERGRLDLDRRRRDDAGHFFFLRLFQSQAEEIGGRRVPAGRPKHESRCDINRGFPVSAGVPGHRDVHQGPGGA